MKNNKKEIQEKIDMSNLKIKEIGYGSNKNIK